MRPAVLFPLFAAIATLPGVGPALAKTLAAAGRRRASSICCGTCPRRWSTGGWRRRSPRSQPPPIATLRLRVIEHEPAQTRRQPYRILCADDAGGEIVLVFFNPRSDYLLKMLPPGEARIVSGLVERYGELRQMVHPDYIVSAADADAPAGHRAGLSAGRRHHRQDPAEG